MNLAVSTIANCIYFINMCRNTSKIIIILTQEFTKQKLLCMMHVVYVDHKIKRHVCRSCIQINTVAIATYVRTRR